MNKLVAALAAGILAVSTSAAIAADAPPKAPAADAKAAAPAKPLERPANVTAEAWAKMTDAEKQKAVDAANKAKAAATTATKDAPKAKEKKGGC